MLTFEVRTCIPRGKFRLQGCRERKAKKDPFLPGNECSKVHPFFCWQCVGSVCIRKISRLMRAACSAVPTTTLLGNAASLLSLHIPRAGKEKEKGG